MSSETAEIHIFVEGLLHAEVVWTMLDHVGDVVDRREVISPRCKVWDEVVEVLGLVSVCVYSVEKKENPCFWRIQASLFLPGV